jgi:hypothetical protein
MTSERTALETWAETLIDPARSPGERRDAAWAWYHRWADLLALEPEASAAGPLESATHTRLDSGLAISPLDAARCLWEHERTAMFLRGLDAAITEAMARFPGERIEVLEAGCGPFAPLALALAARRPASEVSFTLLDIHQTNLDSALRLAAQLGLSGSITALPAVDATAVRLETAPHIIVCELLQRGLSREPQVAATINLAPQLRPGGLFLPERVDVHLLGDSPQPGARFEDLGLAFRLDAGTGAPRTRPPDAPPVAPVAMTGQRLSPINPSAVSRYSLMARIEVFGVHQLLDNACSLNIPLKTDWPAGATTVQARYQLGAAPGVILEAAP